MLYIFRGLPGSGKSTSAKKIGCLHVECDMYHYHGGEYIWQEEFVQSAIVWCHSVVHDALSRGIDVAVAGTFVRVSSIEPYALMANKFNCNISVYKCTGDYGSIHNVPESSLISMRESWEDYPDEISIWSPEIG